MRLTIFNMVGSNSKDGVGSTWMIVKVLRKCIRNKPLQYVTIQTLLHDALHKPDINPRLTTRTEEVKMDGSKAQRPKSNGWGLENRWECKYIYIRYIRIYIYVYIYRGFCHVLFEVCSISSICYLVHRKVITDAGFPCRMPSVGKFKLPRPVWDANGMPPGFNSEHIWTSNTPKSSRNPSKSHGLTSLAIFFSMNMANTCGQIDRF